MHYLDIPTVNPNGQCCSEAKLCSSFTKESTVVMTVTQLPIGNCSWGMEKDTNRMSHSFSHQVTNREYALSLFVGPRSHRLGDQHNALWRYQNLLDVEPIRRSNLWYDFKGAIRTPSLPNPVFHFWP